MALESLAEAGRKGDFSKGLFGKFREKRYVCETITVWCLLKMSKQKRKSSFFLNQILPLHI
ncbi:hypothetical protein EZS27_042674 [termite gut metagenome]|uniref:Uncharacterized protein n=1 Tax=termite gut metagenome TaxID=433724 RepID=A0A5J4PAU9_9ZZZZ